MSRSVHIVGKMQIIYRYCK